MSLLGTIFGQTDYQAQTPTLEGEQDRQNRFAQAISQIQGRTGPQDQFRTGQMGLVDTLQKTASGNGPSVAGQFLQNANDQTLAGANAMAASARGNVNPAMVQRIAMSNAAQGTQQNAAQAALMKQQEALNAQNQLAGVLNSGRSQDLQFQGLNDQTTLGYEGLGIDAAKADQNAGLQTNAINAGIAENNAANLGKITGGVISGLAGMGASAVGHSPTTTAAHGALIPGKPIVPGDSRVNDRVPAMLSPGEVVVPRSVVDHGNAQKFVEALKASRGGHPQPAGFGAVLAARAALYARHKGMK